MSTAGAARLGEHTRPRPGGTTLVFAELKDPVRRKLDRYGLIPAIGPSHFFPTLDDAIEAFRSDTGAEWVPPRPGG